MIRNVLHIAVAAILLIAPLNVAAQQAEKMYRIGYLHPGNLPQHRPRLEAFRQGLRDLGYVEGRNIEILYRIADGRPDRLPGMAADLIQRNVDIIVVCCQPAVDVARKATRTIPIVVGVTADFVGQGLVKSLRRPGGNVTGLSASGPEVVGKRLQLFKEIVPALSRVAVLHNLRHRAHPKGVRRAKAAAKVLGLSFVDIGVRSPAGFPAAFQRMAEEGVDGILVLRGGMLRRNKTRIVALAAKAGRPISFGHRDEAEAGGLMAYGTDNLFLFRRAASFVDKILKGANPAELPVELPTRFYLTVNLKTAKALGITVPPVILLRADRVIE
jgi:putative ABC transport system substrate-binding protein